MLLNHINDVDTKPKKKDKVRIEGKGCSCWLGDVLECCTNHLDDLNKSFWENIYFWRVVVWYGVNKMILRFSEASMPPSSHYSLNPFLQIIPVENIQFGTELDQFRRLISSDDLCLLFCLYSSSMFITFSSGKRDTLSRPEHLLYPRVVADNVPGSVVHQHLHTRQHHHPMGAFYNPLPYYISI